jgi:hypothetical protein
LFVVSLRPCGSSFKSRADREGVKDRFAAAFARVALPKSAAVTKTFGGIKSLAGLGHERFYAAKASAYVGAHHH